MPNVTAAITGAQDFYVYTDTATSPETAVLEDTRSFLRVGSSSGINQVDMQLGLSLEGLNIPKGAALSNFVLDLTYVSTSGSSLPILVQATDENAPTRPTTAESAYARPRMPATEYPAINPQPASGTHITFDVTAVLQAVVNRPGYTQGDRIVLFMLTTAQQGASRIQFHSSETTDPAQRPALTGTYTGGLVATGTATRPARSASGTGTQIAERTFATFTGAQDGWVYRNTATTPETLVFDTSATFMRTGNHRTLNQLDIQSFLCFEGLNLPKGAKLEGWVLELYFQNLVGTAPNAVLAFTDENAPARPVDAADLYARPRAAAQTYALPAAPTSQQLITFDLTALMQAVVDRPGYQQNDRMVLTLATDQQYGASNSKFSYFTTDNTTVTVRPALSGMYSTVTTATGSATRPARTASGTARVASEARFVLDAVDPAGRGSFYPHASRLEYPRVAAKVRYDNAAPYLLTSAANPTTSSTYATPVVDGEANSVIEADVTVLTSTATAIFEFRRRDSSNLWQVYANSTGALTLFERNAGTSTARGTATGVFAVGGRYRVQAAVQGQQIDVYVDGVLRVSYNDAGRALVADPGVLIGGGANLTRHSLSIYAPEAQLAPVGASGGATRPARTASGTAVTTDAQVEGVGTGTLPGRTAVGGATFTNPPTEAVGEATLPGRTAAGAAAARGQPQAVRNPVVTRLEPRFVLTRLERTYQVRRL